MPIPERMNRSTVSLLSENESAAYQESNVHALMLEHAPKIPVHILREVRAGRSEVYLERHFKIHATTADVNGNLLCDTTRQGPKMRRKGRFLSGKYIVQEHAVAAVPVIIKTDAGPSKVFYSPREKWLVLKEDNQYSRNPEQLFFLYIG